MADEAVGEVSLDVLLDGNEFGGGHGVDGTLRGGRSWFEGNFQVVLAVGRQGVGHLLTEDVEVVMVSNWNLGVQGWVMRRGYRFFTVKALRRR